uniref:Uncharacterized protein n=1 Tax=Ciona intestinalis TaxID=7719 RepID=H2XKV4_CIOIN
LVSVIYRYLNTNICIYYALLFVNVYNCWDVQIWCSCWCSFCTFFSRNNGNIDWNVLHLILKSIFHIMPIYSSLI